MTASEDRHFLAAVIIAAQLHHAMIIARDISITASNAKSLALRAGASARGFVHWHIFISSRPGHYFFLGVVGQNAE